MTWNLSSHVSVPVPGTGTETWVLFYNVGTRTFPFLKRRRFQNVEHENGDVGHVPVPMLLGVEHEILVHQTLILL